MPDAAQTELFKGLDAITAWVKTWGIPLAAIGTVSMALLETAKNIFPLRSRFQRDRFRAWLKVRSPKDFLEVENDLIALAAAGDPDAFYDAPIEQLCAEIKSSLTAVLDYPKLHIALLKCLASQADPKDLKQVFKPPAADTFLKRADQSTHEEREAIRKYAAAKTRIGAQVRCSIDAIQTSIGFRWKRRLRVISLLLSAILGVIALHIGASPSLPPSLGASVLIGLLSGFLAPVARDLVAAVEKWRR